MVNIFIPKESVALENRVAATPETVKRFVKAGKQAACPAPRRAPGGRDIALACRGDSSCEIGDPARSAARGDVPRWLPCLYSKWRETVV